MLIIGSTEHKIQTALNELGCSIRDFAAIASVCGFDVARSSLTHALAGSRNLDYQTGRRLLDLIDELRLAQQLLGEAIPHGLPLDWSKTERIADVRLIALLKKVQREELSESETK